MFDRRCVTALHVGVLLLAWLLFVRSVAAATTPEAAASGAATSAPGAEAQAAEDRGNTDAAEEPSVWQQGPTRIDLGHDVVLDLPQQHAFLPKEYAAQALKDMGNTFVDDVLGLVASADHGSDWFVVIEYDGEGHVKDDEAIDADDLLSSLREGTEEANEQRKERGFKPLTLDGWSEPPHYDKQQHRLVWALVVSDADGKSVNYNTRLLGRRGFTSLNLVTEPEKLGQYKAEALTLLSATHYGTGARYEDFQPEKDKVAEYGLAGLVAAGAGVGAAKLVKVGLLAKFWKLILVAIVAGKKFIVVALIALGALVKKLLSGRKSEPAG
jgi:uncharacterized membrane-anchored protein